MCVGGEGGHHFGRSRVLARGRELRKVTRGRGTSNGDHVTGDGQDTRECVPKLSAQASAHGASASAVVPFSQNAHAFHVPTHAAIPSHTISGFRSTHVLRSMGGPRPRRLALRRHTSARAAPLTTGRARRLPTSWSAPNTSDRPTGPRQHVPWAGPRLAWMGIGRGPAAVLPYR